MLMNKNIIKLDSNENMVTHDFDMVECLLDVNPNMYPDVNIVDLKSVLSNKYNIPFEEIFCSNGSDYLIKVITSTLLSYKDEVLIPEVAFPTYEIAAKIKECSYKLIPLSNHYIDLKATLDAITENTKLIWVSNPHNPTGTLLTENEIIGFLDEVPSNITVVIDEAYIEYLDDDNKIDSIGIYNKYPNVVILRTMSKAYGIAGARVGYGFAHKHLIAKLKTMIGPFDLNSYAQRLAVEVMANDDYLEKVKEANSLGMAQYEQMCVELGLNYIKSYTSFIMIEMSRCSELTAFLRVNGFMIRDGCDIGMSGWVRISIGTVKQNALVIEKIKKFFNL